MSMAAAHDDRTDGDLRDHWFRHLDQRRIFHGAREWAVQVTAIHSEEDTLWIQIADDMQWTGSLLLRVRSTASVEQAVLALNSRPPRASSYPLVINTYLPRGVS